jgi:hypothetical protein
MSHDQEVINITTEVEQLRLQYDGLMEQRKKKEAEGKLKHQELLPNRTQIRLYEEGKMKLMIQRSKLTGLRNDDTSRRDPAPIAICERLYEEGMNKLIAEKMAEKRQEEEEISRSLRTRDPSPIPICDRLYAEGMNKVMGEKKRMASNSKRRSMRSVSPIPICDRLYAEGMMKKKSGRCSSNE